MHYMRFVTKRVTKRLDEIMSRVTIKALTQQVTKMQDPNDIVTGDIIPKRPGRPAKNGVAMTAADRQRAYRNRVRNMTTDAELDPSLASRPELLKALNARLQQLEDDFDRPAVRSTVEKLVQALVTRYDLKI